MLFTSMSGQRRLRIHNLSLNVCSAMTDLFKNIELDTLINFISKSGTVVMRQNKRGVDLLSVTAPLRYWKPVRRSCFLIDVHTNASLADLFCSWRDEVIRIPEKFWQTRQIVLYKTEEACCFVLLISRKTYLLIITGAICSLAYIYLHVAAVRDQLLKTPKDVREAIMTQCAEILACYRKNCANPSSVGQLILPESMKLLPLYSNCVIKNDALQAGMCAL